MTHPSKTTPVIRLWTPTSAGDHLEEPRPRVTAPPPDVEPDEGFAERAKEATASAMATRSHGRR